MTHSQSSLTPPSRFAELTTCLGPYHGHLSVSPTHWQTSTTCRSRFHHSAVHQWASLYSSQHLRTPFYSCQKMHSRRLVDCPTLSSRLHRQLCFGGHQGQRTLPTTLLGRSRADLSRVRRSSHVEITKGFKCYISKEDSIVRRACGAITIGSRGAL